MYDNSQFSTLLSAKIGQVDGISYGREAWSHNLQREIPFGLAHRLLRIILLVS